jgi:hypothetical protein
MRCAFRPSLWSALFRSLWTREAKCVSVTQKCNQARLVEQRGNATWAEPNVAVSICVNAHLVDLLRSLLMARSGQGWNVRIRLHFHEKRQGPAGNTAEFLGNPPSWSVTIHAKPNKLLWKRFMCSRVWIWWESRETGCIPN